MKRTRAGGEGDGEVTGLAFLGHQLLDRKSVV